MFNPFKMPIAQQNAPLLRSSYPFNEGQPSMPQLLPSHTPSVPTAPPALGSNWGNWDGTRLPGANPMRVDSQPYFNRNLPYAAAMPTIRRYQMALPPHSLNNMPKKLPMPMRSGQSFFQQQMLGPAGRTGNALVNEAMKYIGQNRYKYGVFDCSKYVSQVAKSVGFNIGGSTGTQMEWFKKAGRFISGLKGINIGDIIYFKSNASPSGRHVGIYVGNGMMIDNAGRGKPIKKRSISGRSVIGYGRLPGKQISR